MSADVLTRRRVMQALDERKFSEMLQSFRKLFPHAAWSPTEVVEVQDVRADCRDRDKRQRLIAKLANRRDPMIAAPKGCLYRHWWAMHWWVDVATCSPMATEASERSTNRGNRQTAYTELAIAFSSSEDPNGRESDRAGVVLPLPCPSNAAPSPPLPPCSSGDAPA